MFPGVFGSILDYRSTKAAVVAQISPFLRVDKINVAKAHEAHRAVEKRIAAC